MVREQFSIPNTLWSYWESEEPGLPAIVKLCRESWTSNGGFASVHLLSPDDIYHFLSPDDLPLRFNEMPPVKKANAVRLAVLAKHGGYWCDAGVLTTDSIACWVKEKASATGFFVFQDVDSSRALDTWFIAGSTDSPFLQEWHRLYQKFFDRKRIHEAHSLSKTPYPLATHLIVAINKVLGFSVTRRAAWARFPLSCVPMYPYFIMHYLANSMLAKKTFKREFSNMEKIGAARALRIRSLLDQGNLTQANAYAAKNEVPIHKLNTYRKYTSEELSTLARLLSPSASEAVE